MNFSEEEIKEIDTILAEVDEEQRNNGNILYSFDEISKEILYRIKREENYKLQDIHY